MTDFIVIIPARLNSSRLPNKALADIGGKPMVQHVYEQARKSLAAKVFVATDHPDIRQVIEKAGGNALMTSPDHASGTDRLAECVNQLALDDDDIIVNVQGDEPFIPPAIINQVARNLATRPAAGMATLCEVIHDKTTFLIRMWLKWFSVKRAWLTIFHVRPSPGTAIITHLILRGLKSAKLCGDIVTSVFTPIGPAC